MYYKVIADSAHFAGFETKMNMSILHTQEKQKEKKLSKLSMFK